MVREWIREHALLSGAASGLVVAGITGVLGFLGVEFLGIWSQHQDGNDHVKVVKRLDEISDKLDAKPDKSDIERLVRDTVGEELQLTLRPTLAALDDVLGTDSFKDAFEGEFTLPETMRQE